MSDTIKNIEEKNGVIVISTNGYFNNVAGEAVLEIFNEKIDSGMLIDDYQISILKNDNPNILKKKLEKGIPSLIESLEKYLSNEIVGMEIKNGIYYPRIIEEDFTIDLKSDSLEIIDRKIRSQEAYNGAILIHKGKKYYMYS